MRRLLLLCLFLPACLDGAGVSDPPPVDEMSCEAYATGEQRVAGYSLDVMIVISDGVEMTAYQDSLFEGLDRLAFALEMANIDLRLGVLSSQGFTGPLVINDCDPWFTCPGDASACHHASYQGVLSDAIASLVAAPINESGTPLLQRLDDVFESDDFSRPDAWHAVFVIAASDDTSNWDPSDYAIRLKRRESRDTLVKVVAGSNTPRLDEFASWFPWAPVSLDDPGWIDVFDLQLFSGDLLGHWVDPEQIDVTDVDVDEPGLQLDCMAAFSDGVPIPRCRMREAELPDAANTLPCYWLRDDWFGPIPVVETESLVVGLTELRCACAS